MPLPILTAVPRDGTLGALRPGDGVDGVFVCTRKERLTARTGAPYLALELRDRSGALPARLFRDADLQGGRFDAGELVRVRGRVRVRVPLRAFLNGRPGVYRRMRFAFDRTARTAVIHEAAVDFALGDAAGTQIWIETGDARLIARPPKMAKYDDEFQERFLSLPLPDRLLPAPIVIGPPVTEILPVPALMREPVTKPSSSGPVPPPVPIRVMLPAPILVIAAFWVMPQLLPPLELPPVPVIETAPPLPARA